MIYIALTLVPTPDFSNELCQQTRGNYANQCGEYENVAQDKTLRLHSIWSLFELERHAT